MLHSESTTELPTVGYFVLFDWVYVLAYLAIFLSLLEAVVAFRLFDAGRAAIGARLDVATGPVVTIGYIAGVALIALA